MERKADGAYGSNAALLRLAAEGDESAVSRLVEKNSALVYKIAHSFGGRGCEFDDLVQIGSIVCSKRYGALTRAAVQPFQRMRFR